MVEDSMDENLLSLVDRWYFEILVEGQIEEEREGDGWIGGKIWGDKKIALKSGCNFCLEFSDD